MSGFQTVQVILDHEALLYFNFTFDRSQLIEGYASGKEKLENVSLEVNILIISGTDQATGWALQCGPIVSSLDPSATFSVLGESLNRLI